jgi:hypothetical protein
MNEDAVNDRTDAAHAESVDVDRSMTLDGNAVAGLLEEIFGTDLTAQPCDCGHCGNQAQVGSLRAFGQGPGVILRCAICGQVMMRIVQTPDATYLDLRGTALLRMTRH